MLLNDKLIFNPFLFLEPYGLNQNYKLKGREKETNSLLALLKWKEIIVVYGKSGVGKTSFINHTLANAVNRVRWLPIRITRSLDINRSLRSSLTTALLAESIDDIHNPTNDRKLSVDEDKTEIGKNLVELSKELYVKGNRPIYFIIDQLEELFLLGDKSEQVDFLENLQDLLNCPAIQKKVILVLREEYLGYIQEIERIISGVFQDALPIKEIVETAKGEIYDNLLEKEITRDFANKISSSKDKILESCTQDKGFYAQKLQIILFLLWERIHIKNEGETDIKLFIENLEKTSNPLIDFLGQTVNDELSSNGRLLMAPYWFILRKLISEADTKKPVSLSELFNYFLIDIASSLPGTAYQLAEGSQIIGRQIEDLVAINKAEVRKWCEDLVLKRIIEEIGEFETRDEREKYFQLKHDTLVQPIKSLDNKLVLRFQKKWENMIKFQILTRD